MKKITLLLLLACISIGTMHAQVKGNGYYRVQNVTTGRYMSLTTEETRGISMQSTTVDASALLTKKNGMMYQQIQVLFSTLGTKAVTNIISSVRVPVYIKSSTIISASNIMKKKMYIVPGNPRAVVPFISATTMNIRSAKIPAM